MPPAFRNQPLKGNIMNIHKHMEAIFVVAFTVVVLGTSAFDSTAQAGAGSAPVIRDVAATPADAAAVACAAQAPRRA
ncbi:hypothetical protein AB595_00520 [Massilia sp. WF1]|nr:hypothetical protein AM586_00390 [Massilia sp. WG5]KLU38390.1 hypothetical protein AB595_00520 [Massilia sp. WF1]